MLLDDRVAAARGRQVCSILAEPDVEVGFGVVCVYELNRELDVVDARVSKRHTGQGGAVRDHGHAVGLVLNLCDDGVGGGGACGRLVAVRLKRAIVTQRATSTGCSRGSRRSDARDLRPHDVVCTDDHARVGARSNGDLHEGLASVGAAVDDEGVVAVLDLESLVIVEVSSSR